VGSGDAEPSAPPYEDLMSDEESQEGSLARQAQGTMHLGIPPWAKNFPSLAKSPLQAALQAARSQGKGTAGFKFYLMLETPDPA
jgi:hypothetical protein